LASTPSTCTASCWTCRRTSMRRWQRTACSNDGRCAAMQSDLPPGACTPGSLGAAPVGAPCKSKKSYAGQPWKGRHSLAQGETLGGWTTSIQQRVERELVAGAGESDGPKNQRAFQFGLRFSTKDRGPSLWSSDCSTTVR